MKTIVAISTPIGSGGISIVRLSGPSSFSIAKKMVEKVKNKNKEFEFRKMYLCKIKTEYFCDLGLVVFFNNPESFTGEDMVEFQIHGGVYLANGVVNECLKLGAQMAAPGEFSKRAFLNGKMSLEQSEGVIDLINSENDAQAAAAFNLASGEFFKVITNIQEKITNILAEINVNLDYPDEETVGVDDQILGRINEVNTEIDNALNTYEKGKIIKYGINCAIVGLPNAGKSSLLNALLNEERAIVSNIAGTTRDIIKESFLINGLKVNLIDTAGINEAKNEIEKIGVERALKEAKKADVVLFLFDGSKKFGKENEELLNGITNNNIIIIQNKTDISIKENKLNFNRNNFIKISAKTKQGIEELKQKIYDLFATINNNASSVIITNERHFNALKKASQKLNESLKLVGGFKSLDILSGLVEQAYNHLGEITGEVGCEKIIDEIFSKFCLGK